MPSEPSSQSQPAQPSPATATHSQRSHKVSAFSEGVLEFGQVLELISARCLCDMGRRRVAHLAPMPDEARLRDAIALVDEMTKLVSERREPPILALRDVASLVEKARPNRSILEPGELLLLKDFIEVAGYARKFFEPLREEVPGLHALAMPLQGLPALRRSIDEKIASDATVRDAASEALAGIRGEIGTLERGIQENLGRMARELAASGDLSDDFYTLRNGRYVLPVKTGHRGRVPGIIHDQSNTEETVFIEPFSILEQTNKLADLRVREREEVYRILLKMAGHVRDELNGLLTNVEILGEFDLVWAKARFGRDIKGAFPALTGMDRPMNLVDAHHPLLYANNPETSRALHVGLDAADRVLVITGPNAGGKTTALKTVGLTALLVQSGVPAPISPKSRMPIFAGVLADIGDEQDLLEGFSTFSAHMRRIAGIIKRQEAAPAALVLLDELGSATDPGEGGALAVGVLETLAERGALTICSSHLGSLKAWASSHPSGRNASFRLGEKDRRPTFRLTMDLPGISEAFAVAEREGMPEAVLAKARKYAPEGERDATALVLSLQEKEARLVDEVRQAADLREGLEEREEKARELEAKLRDERAKLRQGILAERDKAASELKAKVEKLIAGLPSKAQLLEAKKLAEDEAKAVEAERESARRQGPGGKAARASGELRVGDRVFVKTFGQPGVVEAVKPGAKEAKVLMGRIATMVKAGDLDLVKRVEEIEAAAPGASQPSEATAAAATSGAVRFKRPENPESVLDLHGCRVDEALERFEKFLDQALISGFSSARVMHGQGSGALGRALHAHFRKHPALKGFRYAEAHEGGGGVTIVEFK